MGYEQGFTPTGGWTKMPNGLYLQWGSFFFPVSSGNNFLGPIQSFPVAFPNNCAQVYLTLRGNPDNGDEGDEVYWISSFTNTTFRVSSRGDAPGILLAWFAIGN